ncbi:MFS transporter [Longispora fulva]|uniref:MFS family permease n=1 Tax=Longispora fulva TaxID=619741 RepID=A0A8J7GUT1_9ACTN|nr:MFS transporter [Longispora fulva]MBG6139925.1 MFS family permease [Longispora fulva]GIG57691.1 MFS transporter [Longispora fulva]
MRGWLQQTTGGLPKTFWYLWSGTLISRAGAFVTILLTFYLSNERHFKPTFVGLVIGMIGAGGAVGVLIGGQLADRWGRRSTLLVAQVGTAVMLVLLGLTQERWLIVVMGFVLGLVQNMSRPAFSAMMVDIVPDKDRLRAFSLNYWAINLGFSVAALLGGLVADLDYLWIFIVDAATMLLTALIVFLKVPETRPQAAARPAVAGPARPSSSPFLDPVYLGLVGLTFLSAMVFMQHLSSLPLAMARDGLSARTFGTVIALNGILIVLGQLFIPRLVRGRDRSKTLAMASLIVGVGFGLTALAHDLWLYSATVLIWTLGEMLQSPSNSTLIAELSPADARGRYQGVFSLAFSGAAFAAPLVGGFVFDEFGNAPLWIGCLVLSLLVAGLNLAAGPARNRRTAALKEPELVNA